MATVLPRVKTPEYADEEPPFKARAVELDESLNETQRLKGKAQQLATHQQKAAEKMKQSKGELKSLRNEMMSMQNTLNSVKASKEEHDKATADARTKLERLQSEHAVLQATHNWSKSSLDSALAAQEQHRKDYNQLRTAFKKSKEDLAKKEEEVEAMKAAQQDLEKSKGALSARERDMAAELEEVQDTLRKFVTKQKDKSKAVLDRMLGAQGAALMTFSFQNWQKAVAEEKGKDYSRKELEAAQAQLTAYQSKKKDEAKSVLDRMSAASNGGLLSLIVSSWVKVLADAKKEIEEAEKLQETLKNQKTEARKALERHLGSSASGAMSLAFKNWQQYFLDWKKENELKKEAENALKEFQKKKRGESMSVVGRMAGQKVTALLAQVMLAWLMSTKEEMRMKALEKEMNLRYEELVQEKIGLQQGIQQKLEDIEDAEEELAESKKKNKMLKEQVLQVEKMQDDMENSLKEFDDD